MIEDKGTFRFTYFTDKYDETCDFYSDKLECEIGHSWDRSENDKGSLFKLARGVVEILHKPGIVEDRIPGLDYRTPQGVFMGIQVWDIDSLYQRCIDNEVPIQQEVVDQAWGHRSFSVIEPNGLVLFFYQEMF